MNRLKLWRIQNRYTQPEAAAMLKMGLSTYCLLESGRLAPSEHQMEQLSVFFGCLEAYTLFSPVSEHVKVCDG